MNVLVTRAPAGLNYQLQSTNQGDLEVEVAAGGGPTPGAGQPPQAGLFSFDDVTVAANDQDHSAPSNPITALALTGLAAFPENAGILLMWSGAVRGAAGAAAGSVLAGMQVEFSVDNGVSWGSVGNNAQGAFVAVDDTVPNISLAASSFLFLDGITSILFRADRFVGVGSVNGALFEFTRLAWVYAAPPVTP